MRQATTTEMLIELSGKTLTERLETFDPGDRVLMRFISPITKEDRSTGRWIGRDDEYDPGEDEPPGPRFLFVADDDEDPNLVIYPEWEEIHMTDETNFADLDRGGWEQRYDGKIVDVEPLPDHV